MCECSHSWKVFIEFNWALAINNTRRLISLQVWHLLLQFWNLRWWIESTLEWWLLYRWLKYWVVLRYGENTGIFPWSLVTVLSGLLNTLLPILLCLLSWRISVHHMFSSWLSALPSLKSSLGGWGLFRTHDITALTDYLRNIYNSLFCACCSPYILSFTNAIDICRCFWVIWCFALTSRPSPLSVRVDSIRKNSSLWTRLRVKDTWLTCWKVHLCFCNDRTNNLRLHCRNLLLNFWHFLVRYFSNFN